MRNTVLSCSVGRMFFCSHQRISTAPQDSRCEQFTDDDFIECIRDTRFQHAVWIEKSVSQNQIKSDI
jgi:hypothetical protein